MTAYADTAIDYLDRGYLPLPLPPRAKKNPPPGFTGAGGIEPDRDQVVRWIAERGDGNVAIRLTGDVVGIDVDHYGDKRGLDDLARIEAVLGELPPTIMSTSRDNRSGIRLFRVPVGTQLRGSIGPTIEVIQRTHRYVVAPPSVHPEGRIYRWVDSHTGADLVDPWDIDQLPPLPDAWIDYYGDEGRNSAPKATEVVVEGFRAEHQAHGDQRRLVGLEGLLAKSRESHGRHDTLVGVACHAMREAAAGAYRADDAIAVLRSWWVRVMDDRARLEGREFDEAIAYAVAQVAAEPDKVEQIRTEIAASTFAELVAFEPSGADVPMGWEPADLAAAIGREPLTASLLTRLDGVGLIYPGRIHTIFGETEALKTWWAHVCALQVLESGGRVLVLDYEDTDATFVDRFAALNAPTEVLVDLDRLRFHSPEGAVPHQVLAGWIEWAPTLVVVDGVTAAMEQEQLEPSKGPDVARWYRSTLRPLADAGAAVVTLDHVTKSVEGRGKYPIESVHKLNGITGAAFSASAIKPLSRARLDDVDGVLGITRLVVAKDRPGGLRAHARTDGSIADLHLTSWPDGGVTYAVRAPGERPRTDVIDRIIEHLTNYVGATKTSLRELGNSQAIDDALRDLIAAGRVRVEASGNAHKHYLVEVQNVAA